MAGVSDDDATVLLSTAVKQLSQQAELAAWFTDSFQYVVKLSLLFQKQRSLISQLYNTRMHNKIQCKNILKCNKSTSARNIQL